jgi:hypothetical protein
MWTFGICYITNIFIEKIVNSIVNQKNNKKYEIILIGPYDEKIKKNRK